MRRAKRLLAALRRHAEQLRCDVEDLESDGVVAAQDREDLASVRARIDRLEAS